MEGKTEITGLNAQEVANYVKKTNRILGIKSIIIAISVLNGWVKE